MTHYRFIHSLAVALAIGAAGCTLASCHRLSPEAKRMVGSYYIPEVAENTALLELRRNGRCTIRNIKPGVLTISVDGRWNVKDDSLVAKLDPRTLVAEGDTTLVGNIPEHYARKIIDFNDLNLTLEGPGGISYVYLRRQ